MTGDDAMDAELDRQLLRLLAGELSAGEEAAVRRRLAGEPVLAARHAALDRLWSRLEPPATAPPPLAFAARLAARSTAEPAALAGPSWRLAPGWARVAAGVALAAGIAAGVFVGHSPAGGTGSAGFDGPALTLPAEEPSLAEAYWRLVAEIGSTDEAVQVPAP